MSVTVLTGDCRAILPTLADGSVQACVTSPPYFNLRPYLPDDHPDKALEIGLEMTPDEYIAAMVEVFDEVRRVLRDDGTCWINIGDSYSSKANGTVGRGANRPGEYAPHAEHRRAQALRSNGIAPGMKHKDLIGIPYMLAFALRAAGWYWRDLIVWAKPNAMPGSQPDRCTSSHEAVLLLSKSSQYFSDFDAIKTPPREATLVRLAQDVQAQAGSHRANGGAKTNGPMKAVSGKTDKQRGHSRRHAGFNERWDAMERGEQQSAPAMMRNVWFVSPSGYAEAHFAVMPEEVARRCILAGTKPGDLVLDPFGGAGTTGLVADRLNRNATLIELNPAYRDLAARRINEDAPLFGAVT